MSILINQNTFRFPAHCKQQPTVISIDPRCKQATVNQCDIEGFETAIVLGKQTYDYCAIRFSGETDREAAEYLADKSAIFLSPGYSSVRDCTILGGDARKAYHAYQALTPWGKVWFAFKAALFGGSK